ncbi:MAG: hypothetical protein ABJB47_24035 [Actinomycetota bacterium]
MSHSYLMSRKMSLTNRFAITDETGLPQFEVQGRLTIGTEISIIDRQGALAAVITGRALSSRYEIQAGGLTTAIRPRGFFGNRYEITSPGGQLEARGNFSGRTYAVARGGMTVATVTQQWSLREKFAVEVADGEDPVLMLAIVLTIEIIRDKRRRAAAASS